MVILTIFDKFFILIFIYKKITIKLLFKFHTLLNNLKIKDEQ